MARRGVATWAHWGLVAAVALLPALAGCIGDRAPEPLPVPEPAPYAVEATEVQAGRFYAFDHDGGLLSLRPAAGASAQVELFDGQDRRVAEYGLGGGEAGPDVQMELGAGNYVLRFAALNGTISMASAGTPVQLMPLESHVERVVLAQEPKGAVPNVPFVPLRPTHIELDVNLTRTPTGMRLWTDGSFNWLELALGGPAGEVFRATSGPTASFGDFGTALREVEGLFHASRARNERLVGKLDVEDLQGALILESFSYSRAIPPGQDLQGQRPGRPPFEYGLLPSVPVAFEVAPSAQRLYFAALADAREVGPFGGGPDSIAAWVSVFGPDDRKLASVPVRAGTYTTLAVNQPGTYVAVLLQGNATLGADAAPKNLGLLPLGVEVQEGPQRPAGSSGNYGQDSEELAAVPFDVRPTRIDDPFTSPIPSLACSMQESLRILQDGEVVAAFGPMWDSRDVPAGALLGNGPVTLWHDGFGGSGCMRNGVALHSYRR